ncbi:hypothetical protein Sfulv_59250 [Streptomyces fulvorobeus]|uniref:Uncharacterized protein n=1 Tax=Streptomyces fulvorobeus TaxID=284028 RepID=A0A7J0CH63_9ACTN|nr:hypothetical protein Sfulv_59250 [Streptomyces fulvorobeus]
MRSTARAGSGTWQVASNGGRNDGGQAVAAPEEVRDGLSRGGDEAGPCRIGAIFTHSVDKPAFSPGHRTPQPHSDSTKADRVAEDTASPVPHGVSPPLPTARRQPPYRGARTARRPLILDQRKVRAHA